jgi:hypothetical protein
MMWKVVQVGSRGTEKLLAWMFPNSNGLGKLSDYEVKVSDIERALNDGIGEIPIPEYLKTRHPDRSSIERRGLDEEDDEIYQCLQEVLQNSTIIDF